MRKLILALAITAAGTVTATGPAAAQDYTCIPERYEVGELALDRPLCLGGVWTAPTVYGPGAYAFAGPQPCRLVQERVSRNGRVITRTRQICD
jgi:hypothetical protein